MNGADLLKSTETAVRSQNTNEAKFFQVKILIFSNDLRLGIKDTGINLCLIFLDPLGYDILTLLDNHSVGEDWLFKTEVS